MFARDPEYGACFFRGVQDNPAIFALSHGTPIANPARPGQHWNVEYVEKGTVRGFIETLTDVASYLPEGLDSAIELGICDGKDLQFIDAVDVNYWFEVATDLTQTGRRYVLIRGHWHGQESPGRVARGVSEDWDDELRKL